MSTVFIVIPNYNGARFLAACLTSLQSGSDFHWNIVVVDDASQDDSIKIVQQHCPVAHLLRLPENKLFAASANVGIEYALSSGADFVFLLNSDTNVYSGCLEMLLDFMKANPLVDACQPLLVDMKNPTTVLSAGLCCSLSGRGWDKFYKKQLSIFDFNKIDGQPAAQPFPVMGCTGGAVLFRAESLIRVLEHETIFDESLKMYLEDMDLCFRFHQKYSLGETPFWCIPKAKVRHIGGGSTAALGTAWKVQLTEKNAYQMVLRYFPLVYMLAGGIIFWVTALMMVVAQSGRGNHKAALGIVQGTILGIREGIACFITKRKSLSYAKFKRLIATATLIPPIGRG